MDILRIVIVIFLLLEAMNVLTLYFAPSSKLANGVGVFNAWEKSKQDPEVHQLVAYLVNWVAGTKLIFIMLLIVILLTANEQTLVYTQLGDGGIGCVVFLALVPDYSQARPRGAHLAQGLLQSIRLDDSGVYSGLCGCFAVWLGDYALNAMNQPTKRGAPVSIRPFCFARCELPIMASQESQPRCQQNQRRDHLRLQRYQIRRHRFRLYRRATWGTRFRSWHPHRCCRR
jgi:hypothetical protein